MRLIKTSLLALIAAVAAGFSCSSCGEDFNIENLINGSSQNTTNQNSTNQNSTADNGTHHFEETDYNGNYYDGIDINSNTLKSDLSKLVNAKRCKGGYSAIWDYLPYCDAAKPDSATDTSVLAYYRNVGGSKGQMNKEHVWPKSHGGNLFEGDPHMVRPTFSSDNSSRGNEFYVQGKNGSGGWDPANFGVPQYRGDAARIIFYCAIVCPNTVSLVDYDSHSTSNANRDNMMGKLSDLLKWNEQYPVSEAEKLRNDVLSGARTVRGKTFHFNRNPFIDHPEYAQAIWG